MTEILDPDMRSRYMPFFDMMVGVAGCILAVFAVISSNWIDYTICMASLMAISTGLIYFMPESNKWLQVQQLQDSTKCNTKQTIKEFFSSCEVIKMTFILG